MYINDLLCYVGNGVDFDSSPITATFTPSSRRTVTRIPLTQDAIIENQETFNMNLMLDTTNPSIMLGSITMAIGVIDDSTGNVVINLIIKLQVLAWATLILSDVLHK